ncbi:unnamed protein product [Linum trigynum]|uniref:Uncharacterized protein n=1 Tax=Linum trigynum TaxID=586398 RepID=A0AAV2ESM6_9ROSI
MKKEIADLGERQAEMSRELRDLREAVRDLIERMNKPPTGHTKGEQSGILVPGKAGGVTALETRFWMLARARDETAKRRDGDFVVEAGPRSCTGLGHPTAAHTGSAIEVGSTTVKADLGWGVGDRAGHVSFGSELLPTLTP